MYIKTLISALAISAGTLAHAGTITGYTDQTAFATDFSSAVTEDFGASALFPISTGVLNASTSISTPRGPISPGDIVDGVTFSTPIGAGNFFNIDSGGGFNGGFLDSIGTTAPRDLTVTFDVAQTAFGFVTNMLMPSFDITINFVSGPSVTQSLSVASNGLEFFGFASSATDITSVVIDGTGSSTFNFALDDFTFSDQPVAPVPLPASLPLLLAGFGAIGLMRRRQKS
ncbi:VPLPA-CTERM sorting domain-containing protein [uncultured Tateyamaria sp.]|uniref:VPLPA-CTERM sorting domain-containing protein n=1 Tax=uncultured Tateyamaria sp. TaxID=455651 RepID=UPI00261EC983|nr:VPLPA-CTERM sorting domain-containing protein [uncultured Tateyamaria sp.]